MRDQIKDALLSLLADDNPTVVKDAGVCLAIIATVELPVGLWENFLIMMAENATNTNL